MRSRFILVIFLFIYTTSHAQIRGEVLDSETKLPLPFCNIQVVSTNIGTTTDVEGNFLINANIGSKIVISFIGYNDLEYTIDKMNVGSLYMHPKSLFINEIVVSYKENPAMQIMRKAIKLKNDFKIQDQIEGITTQEITNVYLLDSNQKMIGLNKSSLFVKISDSMTQGVPFFISERILYDDSLISKNDYGVGIRHDLFVDYITSLNLTFDIHDDLINIFGRSIVSPLSVNAFSFYKYYLLDSGLVGDQDCYKIKLTQKKT